VPKNNSKFLPPEIPTTADSGKKSCVTVDNTAVAIAIMGHTLCNQNPTSIIYSSASHRPYSFLTTVMVHSVAKAATAPTAASMVFSIY